MNVKYSRGKQELITLIRASHSSFECCDDEGIDERAERCSEFSIFNSYINSDGLNPKIETVEIVFLLPSSIGWCVAAQTRSANKFACITSSPGLRSALRQWHLCNNELSTHIILSNVIVSIMLDRSVSLQSIIDIKKMARTKRTNKQTNALFFIGHH